MFQFQEHLEHATHVISNWSSWILNYQQRKIYSCAENLCVSRCMNRNFSLQGRLFGAGDFDEYLIYNIWKKETAGKKFIVFPWHYWNCILNEKFNFSWIQTRLFSQNQGTFCKFQKRTGKTSRPSPCISWLFSGNESLTVNANPLSWKN